MGLAIAAAVGLYDGIVGWKISIVLKANLGKLGELVDEEEMNQMDVGTIIITVVFAVLCGGVGAYFWGI